MRKIRKFVGLLAIFSALLIAAEVDRNMVHAEGGIPPWPLIYTGDVFVEGAPAADGMIIEGVMAGYRSIPLTVSNGRMAGLAVGPPDSSFFGKTITFELNGLVAAAETDVFTNNAGPKLRKDFHLNFPAIPTPTALPTETPLPTATALPATSTPVATATPIVVGTILYNGLVVSSNGNVPVPALLTARVGDYESAPVPVENGQFISLIVDLNDPAYTDKIVRFYLNGIESRTSAVYSTGETIRDIDLIFMGLPAPLPSLPAEMPTLVPPVVPTLSPAPTAEPIAMVATEVPSPTRVPPTAEPTEVPKVDEEDEPEAVKEAPIEQGGCFAVKDIDPLTGTANVLAMIGPLLLLVGYRGYRKIF